MFSSAPRPGKIATVCSVSPAVVAIAPGGIAASVWTGSPAHGNHTYIYTYMYVGSSVWLNQLELCCPG